MFVILGTLALGIFAEGSSHIWDLSVTIIEATLSGVLAGNAAVNDLNALREDMDDETKKTHYGIFVLSAPRPVFRAVLIL